MRRLLVITACVSLLVGLTPAAAQPRGGDAGVPPEPARSATLTTRTAGENRFATAAAIADEAFPSASQVDTVIIAFGGNYPDAIAAAALAGAYDAPILLVNTHSIPPETDEALRRFAPSQLLVLGGPAAVSAANFSILQGYASATRIAGDTRVETATAIARHIDQTTQGIGDINGQRTAILVNEGLFQEPLIAGPFAFDGRHPILLTRGSSLTQATEDALIDLRIDQVLILGDQSKVSDAVESRVATLVETVSRDGATTHVDTAIAMGSLSRVAGFDSEIFLASADNFPDALVGSVLAGRGQRGVIFLADADPDPRIEEWLTDANGTRVTGLGGPVAVSNYALEVVTPFVAPQITNATLLDDGVVLNFINGYSPSLASATLRDVGGKNELTLADSTGAVWGHVTYNPADRSAVFQLANGVAAYFIPDGRGAFVEVAHDDELTVYHVDDLSDPGSWAQVASSEIDEGRRRSRRRQPRQSNPPFRRGSNVSIARATHHLDLTCDSPGCELDLEAIVAQTRPAVTCSSPSARAHCIADIQPDPDGRSLNVVVTHIATAPNGVEVPLNVCNDFSYLDSTSEWLTFVGTYASIAGLLAIPANPAVGAGFTVLGGGVALVGEGLSAIERDAVRCQDPQTEAAALQASGIPINEQVTVSISLHATRTLAFTPSTVMSVYSPYRPEFDSGSTQSSHIIGASFDLPQVCFVPVDYETYQPRLRLEAGQRQSASGCGVIGGDDPGPEPDPDPPTTQPGWNRMNARAVNGTESFPGQYPTVSVTGSGGSGTRVVNVTAGIPPGEWRHSWSWEAPPQVIAPDETVQLDYSLDQGSIEYSGGYSGQFSLLALVYRGVDDTRPVLQSSDPVNLINVSCSATGDPNATDCAFSEQSPSGGRQSLSLGSGSPGDERIFRWVVHNCGAHCAFDWTYKFFE